jgi:hypothetical protein
MTELLHLLVFDKETGMEKTVAVDLPSHLCVCVCVYYYCAYTYMYNTVMAGRS